MSAGGVRVTVIRGLAPSQAVLSVKVGGSGGGCGGVVEGVPFSVLDQSQPGPSSFTCRSYSVSFARPLLIVLEYTVSSSWGDATGMLVVVVQEPWGSWTRWRTV